MEFFNNHRILFGSALTLFLLLTIIIALAPASDNQKNNAPLPYAHTMTEFELAGKEVFIAEGCVACHTQQVRNVDMDKMWGDRPSIAADYAHIERSDLWRNTATLMGTERTGPDLTNAGKRQPSQAWNLLHLYQPRAVVQESIMPAYPWLFEETDSVMVDQVELALPPAFRPESGRKVIASEKALQLAAYIASLKQTDLPDGKAVPDFLYEREEVAGLNPADMIEIDGELLYSKYCQSCHQANGKGLPGAFPSLKGSPIVLGDDLELFTTIIMKGYDARPEYAVMTAIGLDNDLSTEEVVAIMNHERTSWGNEADKVDADEVARIMEFIKITAD